MLAKRFIGEKKHWIGLFQMFVTFLLSAQSWTSPSKTLAQLPPSLRFFVVSKVWQPSSYLSPSQSPSLTSLSLSSSLCTATRCHDSRQFWSRLYYKFFKAREIWQIPIYCNKMPWKQAILKQVDQPWHKLPDWFRSSRSSLWKMLTPPLLLRHCTWDKLNR